MEAVGTFGLMRENSGMRKWLSIATAPHDGTIIIVGRDRMGNTAHIAWQGAWLQCSPSGARSLVDGMGFNAVEWHPRHA